MPPILLSARELANVLDVSYESVISWVRFEKIPVIRDGQRRLIFNLDAVVQALRESRTALEDEATNDPDKEPGDRRRPGRPRNWPPDDPSALVGTGQKAVAL